MRFFLFKKIRKTVLYHQGDHHHLDEVWTRVNTEYFDGKLKLEITWFNRRHSRLPRKIVLGSYHDRRKLIRINRYLDQEHIPDYFVSYIVYHEALHHVFRPVRGKRGKRSIHHEEFKSHEKKFKYYDDVQKFRQVIRKNLFEETTHL